MKALSGIPVSAGIAIGKAFLFVADESPEIPRWTLSPAQVHEEWQRFLRAIAELTETFNNQFKRTEHEANKEQAAILKAHILMLEDVDFHEQLRRQMEKELQNIEWVVWSVSHSMTQKLLAAQDAYLRERAVDIADIARQILAALLSVKQISLADLDEDVIVVAHDLLPSQALNMNKTHVKALAIDAGSTTAHTAILARSFDIPAVLGLSTCTKEINSGDTLIIDGNKGIVYIHPDAKTLAAYKAELVRHETSYFENFSLIDHAPETLDGVRFSLKANIELSAEVSKALKFGAEGVGLFRSEFLFLSGETSAEENQYQAYRHAVELAAGHPVKIRTSDVGGDKMIPNFFPKEEKNPLLGWRAIRFSLAMKELFKTQLRAILRAAAHGSVQIIFPLISSIEEFEDALALLEEAKSECKRAGQPIDGGIKTGIMIEVPSAAITAEILAKKADFFSIGTNDLVQYTLAADRGNEKVNYLTCGIHPAVLRLIKTTIDAAHNEGKIAAMCGEMAGIPRWTPLLAGLGLDEFSMTASAIPEVKRVLRGVHAKKCRELAAAALQCSRAAEIDALLDNFSCA